MKKPYRWTLAAYSEPTASALAQALGVSEATGAVLAQRGVTSFEEARAFFRPDWDTQHDGWQMRGMQTAVARLAKALQANEKILVYGDYDVDGTTSIALTCALFRRFGVAHDFYVPDRVSEGYGISLQGIDHAVAMGATILLAFDCGTKELDKAAYAASKGLDLIICDHHTPGAELPQALALLNPRQPDCPYPFKELPGCGIALKLMQCLAQEMNWEVDFREYSEFPALAIACDLVPMLGENRVIAATGLQKLKTVPSAGIAALMRLSDRERRWDASDAVFYLGPRINAAGRMGHASNAVKLLLGDLPTDDLPGLNLEQHNDERREVEQQMAQQAFEMIDAQGRPARRSVVLHSETWHKGVIGIVAAKVVERYYLPTVLLTRSNGHYAGSCRSIQGFDLYEALTACREHLIQFGGHMYAAGLTIAPEKVDAFTEAFEQYCQQNIQPQQLDPILEIACELPLNAINEKFVRVQHQMAPFGPGNLHPYYIARDVEVKSARLLKDRHLKLTLLQHQHVLDAIGFDLGQYHEHLGPGARIDIAYYPDFNSYNGRVSIQLILKDIRLL